MTLEERVAQLEKRVAELEVQAQVQPAKIQCLLVSSEVLQEFNDYMTRSNRPEKPWG